MLNSVSGAQIDMETHHKKQSLGLPQSGHTNLASYSHATYKQQSFSVTYVNWKMKHRNLPISHFILLNIG